MAQNPLQPSGGLLNFNAFQGTNVGAGATPASVQQPVAPKTIPNTLGSIGSFFSNAYSKGQQELQNPTYSQSKFPYANAGTASQQVTPTSVPTPQGSSLETFAKMAAQTRGLVPSIPTNQRGTTLGTTPQNSTGTPQNTNLNVGAATGTAPVTGTGAAVGGNGSIQTGGAGLPPYMQNLTPQKFTDATVSNNNSAGYGAGNSGASGDPFAQFSNNPSTQAYLQSITDTYTKLAALQQQLAQANVPSAGELAENPAIFQAQSALANLNPQQYLQNNPSLAAGGITQGQLQNTVAQAGVPIQQALSQALLNKSFMGQQRQIEATNLGAEATGLGAQAGIEQQLRQATMFGGLPPDVASAILQKELFPPYQTFTNIAGQPGVVSEGPGGTFQSQTLGVGGAGGAGAGGGIGGFSDASGQPFNPQTSNSINVAGLPVEISHMTDGTPYVQETKIDSRIADYAKSVLPSMGIPVLSEQNTAKMQSIDVTQQNLAQLGQLLPKILSNGVYGSTVGALLNLGSQYIENNPDIAAFRTYRDTAINTIQALAGGTGSGFRLNQSEINTATSNLPTITDNLETAQKKLTLLNGFLQKWENEILPGNVTQTGANSTPQGSSSGDLYSF